MRRKNWIKKKKFFYDNFLKFNKINKGLFFNIFLKKKEYIFDQYNTRGQLYKVFLKRNKISFLESEFNYYFFNNFNKNLKFLNKRLIFRNFIKNVNNNILILSPNYMFKSQFFSNKSIFNDTLNNFKLKGFFLYKNFFRNINYKFDDCILKSHTIGYNFYIFNKNINKINLNKFLNLTEDKEFNGVGKLKFILKSFEKKSFNELNFFFVFNLYFINIIEIYKIIIFTYLIKI